MLSAKTALCQNEALARATVGVAMDSLEELLETEGLQPDDSFIGWAKAFADAVLEENEVPPDLLELLASTSGVDGTSSNTQPGVPHPVVAASMTGAPRDESSGLHVIRSENTGVREGSGLRVLPPPREEGSGLRAMPGREGSGLRPLPPLPNAGREGSGLHALPGHASASFEGGSGLHALPNASGEDDDGEELEMLDDDELELLDDEGDGDAGASVTGDREAEPEWKRALDDAQSGVLPLPQPPADEATDEAAGEAVDEDEPA
jgi:hypothetical protein